MAKKKKAPGRPGKTPPWTLAAKTGIGKALDAGSHITFSISSGVITESYYPREDTACLGESVFVVADGTGFVSDERTDTGHESSMIDPQVPGYLITNTCKQGRYTITKQIIADPLRNCLLQQIDFTDHHQASLRLHSITIPRFPKDAKVQRAYVEDFNGTEMLFAETDTMVMAVLCSVPFRRRTVGFLGKSDGISQLRKYGSLKNEYELADKGSVCLTAELDLGQTNQFLSITGFGHSHQEAAHNALASMLSGFSPLRERYIAGWKSWHSGLWNAGKGEVFPILDSSATILRVGESKLFPGGMLASLSIPWGSSKVEDGLGAYHLVWPRDLVLSSGGFAALDDKDSVLRVLNYLMTTQLADGSWAQNMWLDGNPNWTGVQLDQVAMPVMMVEFCRSHKLITADLVRTYWPRVKKAIDFLIRVGPASDQDRWEEESGVNTFSLATQVAAFVAAANIADHLDEAAYRDRCNRHADELNERIDELTYVTDTPLCKEHGVSGYYIRINPDLKPANENKNKKLRISKPGSGEKLRVYECIGVDALALVRFGLRSPHDPKILNTIKLIDALLKVELPNGTCWHRYVGDVYGEDEEGKAYEDGSTSGKGRAWPLLTGERAHYEIAAGNFAYAEHLLRSLHQFSSNGMLPEQVWDQPDIPEKGLIQGKATGSAQPLTWAHSEYIKLCRSMHDRRIFDLPTCVYNRYAGKQS